MFKNPHQNNSWKKCAWQRSNSIKNNSYQYKCGLLWKPKSKYLLNLQTRFSKIYSFSCSWDKGSFYDCSFVWYHISITCKSHKKARQMKKVFCFNNCACRIFRTNLSSCDLRFVQVTSVGKREPREHFSASAYGLGFKNLSLGSLFSTLASKTFYSLPFFQPQ